MIQTAMLPACARVKAPRAVAQRCNDAVVAQLAFACQKSVFCRHLNEATNSGPRIHTGPRIARGLRRPHSALQAPIDRPVDTSIAPVPAGRGFDARANAMRLTIFSPPSMVGSRRAAIAILPACYPPLGREAGRSAATSSMAANCPAGRAGLFPLAIHLRRSRSRPARSDFPRRSQFRRLLATSTEFSLGVRPTRPAVRTIGRDDPTRAKTRILAVAQFPSFSTLYVDYGRGTGCAIRRAVAGVGAKRRDHLRVIPRNRSAGRWDRRGGNARSAPTRPRPGVTGRSASSRSRTDDDLTRLRAQPAATALEGSSLQ